MVWFNAYSLWVFNDTRVRYGCLCWKQILNEFCREKVKHLCSCKQQTFCKEGDGGKKKKTKANQLVPGNVVITDAY